jgi:hypothetical protein
MPYPRNPAIPALNACLKLNLPMLVLHRLLLKLRVLCQTKGVMSTTLIAAPHKQRAAISYV